MKKSPFLNPKPFLKPCCFDFIQPQFNSFSTKETVKNDTNSSKNKMSSQKSKSTENSEKNETDDKIELFFNSSYHSIPHIEKKNLKVKNEELFISSGGGEDSFFKLEKSLGIADGVGGWSYYSNGNSALFSRLLMHYICMGLYRKTAISPTDLIEIVDNSHIITNTHKVLGSTTACVCTLNNDKLIVLNIGDSGFMLIRGDNTYFKSTEQIIQFNMPNQLGPEPKKTMDYQIYEKTVKLGDIVILFTDGITDNLFDNEIINIVLNKKFQDNPSKIALELSKKATEKSFSSMKTPFEMAARSSNVEYKGGKPDDVSVVVGIISKID